MFTVSNSVVRRTASNGAQAGVESRATLLHLEPATPTLLHLQPATPTLLHLEPVTPKLLHLQPATPTLLHLQPATPTLVPGGGAKCRGWNQFTKWYCWYEVGVGTFFILKQGAGGRTIIVCP
jgi:hypothetical protein